MCKALKLWDASIVAFHGKEKEEAFDGFLMNSTD